MRLRWKFSLLIGACVLLAVGVTTWVLAHFYLADQEAYLQDFQSTLALSAEKLLESRLDVLYSELGALRPELRKEGPRVLGQIPGALSAEVWDSGKRVQASNPNQEEAPPPPGGSRWTLLRSRFEKGVRWVGRFGQEQVVIDLNETWFTGILESTHGAHFELVLPNGTVLLSSGQHSRNFRRAGISGILARVFTWPPDIPRTQYFDEDGGTALGTFLVLPSAPPLALVISTPSSVVRSVIARTLRKSGWIASFFFLLSIGIGILFSATLTLPLQEFAAQSSELAKGNFDSKVATPENRRDEVGILARSFNQMSRDLSKMRDELRKSERLATLGLFSSAIAHEIKNPLTGILGNTQAARRKLAAQTFEDSDLVKQALEFVEEETLRANTIISQLMKFARQDRPPEQVLDLSDRVRRSIAIIQPLLDQGHVALEEAIPGHPLVCRANGDQLHEVFLNLVLNAIHALKDSPQRKLRIALSAVSDRAVLEIRDSGCGMTAEVKEHLFEPFYTTKGIGEGTGLGLAVCHGIVLNHRGKIEVESELGKGTVFRIYIPIAAA